MKTNLEKFLQILKQWPPNPNRSGRDYGLHLREIAKKHLASGKPFPGSTEENSDKLNSLQALVSNKYYKKYPNNLKFGAAGINVAELKKIMNDEYIKYHNSKKIRLIK